MRDDRKFTTSFYADIAKPGRVATDHQEMLIAADLCDEYGFGLAAELLRDAKAVEDFREPRRQYGWGGNQRSNRHFFTSDRRASALCGARFVWSPSRLVWYDDCAGRCQKCEGKLREQAAEFPGAVEALDRID
jgi:hypothetical protein